MVAVEHGDAVQAGCLLHAPLALHAFRRHRAVGVGGLHLALSLIEVGGHEDDAGQRALQGVGIEAQAFGLGALVDGQFGLGCAGSALLVAIGNGGVLAQAPFLVAWALEPLAGECGLLQHVELAALQLLCCLAGSPNVSHFAVLAL